MFPFIFYLLLQWSHWNFKIVKICLIQDKDDKQLFFIEHIVCQTIYQALYMHDLW